MAIQFLGADGATVAQVEAGYAAQRATIRPSAHLGWFSMGLKTGATTAVAANAAIFSFRNLAANPLMIRRVGIGALVTTAFTAAQQIDYALWFARAWTSADVGGPVVAVTGNNAKHRTSLATVTSAELRIATTAGLTAGVRTLDTSPLSIVGGFSAAAGLGAAIPTTTNSLFSHDTGDHPLILGQNEGIVVAPFTTMGAGGAVFVYVNIEFAEVTSY